MRIAAFGAPASAPFNTSDGRQLRLQGADNARDLGGLPVQGGRIRSGLIYRSSDLARLTDQDVARLGRLPIRTVIDVRTGAEVDLEGGDRYHAPRQVRLPMSYKYDRLKHTAIYRATLAQNHRAIQGFFRTLANPDSYPLLFHCHDGKDRTGMLTALLLLSLGT
ncbi:MAG: tyrosine-protein phosphatase, partial [Candidatus Xenobia bacterium]